ncbi:MAG: GNAT family N-acetyltransferase [Chloroflexota bacterium]|nr:GNAT family N-acetyltransferase [Chloroflexota bacterium]
MRLRAVEPGDWETFFAWNDDDFSARHSSSITFPESREAVKRWTEQVATSEPANDRARWAIENLTGELVGTITTHTCDRRAGTFMYGLVIAAAHQHRGYAREAVQLVLRYFFEELGYQKVTVHVYDFNLPSQQFHERLGFQPEGRLRRMIYTNGAHHDDLVYGLLREEFTTDIPPIDDTPENQRERVPRAAPSLDRGREGSPHLGSPGRTVPFRG